MMSSITMTNCVKTSTRWPSARSLGKSLSSNTSFPERLLRSSVSMGVPRRLVSLVSTP